MSNWDFSKGGLSIVSVKNYQFFHLSILGKKDQKNVFYGILERKKPLLDYLKQKLQKVEKLGFFQRGKSMVMVKIGNLDILF